MIEELETLQCAFDRRNQNFKKAEEDLTWKKGEVRTISERISDAKIELAREIEAGINSAVTLSGFPAASKKVVHLRGEIALLRQAERFYEALEIPTAEIAVRGARVAELAAQIELERARLAHHEDELNRKLAEVAELNKAPVEVQTSNGLSEGYRQLIGRLNRELAAAREALTTQKTAATAAATKYQGEYQQ